MLTGQDRCRTGLTKESKVAAGQDGGRTGRSLGHEGNRTHRLQDTQDEVHELEPRNKGNMTHRV